MWFILTNAMSGPGPTQTPSLSSIYVVKKIVPAHSKLECVCREREEMKKALVAVAE